jgi:hypothetical protein
MEFLALIVVHFTWKWETAPDMGQQEQSRGFETWSGQAVPFSFKVQTSSLAQNWMTVNQVIPFHVVGEYDESSSPYWMKCVLSTLVIPVWTVIV